MKSILFFPKFRIFFSKLSFFYFIYIFLDCVIYLFKKNFLLLFNGQIKLSNQSKSMSN